MSETLKFNLVRKEIPIELDTNVEVMNLTLREIDGKDRDFYLSKMAPKIQFIDGSQAGIRDFTDLQATLINLCLYDSEGNRLGVSVIQQWPASVVSSLFDECQTLCGLTEEAEDELGNDSQGNANFGFN